MKMFIGSMAAFVLLLASPVAAEAPPFGFQFYCLKTRSCIREGAPVVVHSFTLVADLSRVSKSVNRSLRYRADRRENWRAGVIAGDCEDFAMAKRKALIRMGYPPSALRFAVGKTREGKDHAVLVVVSTKGSFVLDNLTDQVLPIRKAKIRITKMASADPNVWVRIASLS